MQKVNKSSKYNKNNSENFDSQKNLKVKDTFKKKYSQIKTKLKYSKKFKILKEYIKNNIDKIKNKIRKNHKYLIFKNSIKHSYFKIKEYTDITYKYVNFVVVPKLLENTEKLNNKIVNEEGSEFWSVLSTSQKWGSKIIWTLVGVSSFGIIYVSFASIDETIQSTGKSY